MTLKIKIFFLLVLVSPFTFGQAGYLGSLDAVAIHINGVPTRGRVAKIDQNSNGDTIQVAPLRYIQTSFGVSYSRVVARKIELSAGYNFVPVKSHTYGSQVYYESGSGFTTSGEVLEDLKGVQHSFNLEFRYYRRGSIAPIGKYMGFATNFGFMSLDNVVTPADIGSQSGSSLWKKVSEVNAVYDPIDLNFNSGKYFSLRAIFGRNYPITSKLLLNFSASLPVISRYKSGTSMVSGFSYFLENSPKNISDLNLRQVVTYTLHKYNRTQLSVALRFQL